MGVGPLAENGRRASGGGRRGAAARACRPSSTERTLGSFASGVPKGTSAMFDHRASRACFRSACSCPSCRAVGRCDRSRRHVGSVHARQPACQRDSTGAQDGRTSGASVVKSPRRRRRISSVKEPPPGLRVPYGAYQAAIINYDTFLARVDSPRAARRQLGARRTAGAAMLLDLTSGSRASDMPRASSRSRCDGPSTRRASPSRRGAGEAPSSRNRSTRSLAGRSTERRNAQSTRSCARS